jgi:hypothetical protein
LGISREGDEWKLNGQNEEGIDEENEGQRT